MPLSLSALLYLSISSDLVLPPWVDPNDIPIPSWVNSLAPRRDEIEIFAGPSSNEPRRGSIGDDIRLPLFGAERGPGCSGRWLLVGPLAWICADSLMQSADEPGAPPAALDSTRLPFAYFFVGKRGAVSYLNLESSNDSLSDQDYEPNAAVAIAEERVKDGIRWGHVHKGGWVALRDLTPAQLSSFRGVEISDKQVRGGWVRADKAPVFTRSNAHEKPIGVQPRRTFVTWAEQDAANATMVEVTPSEGTGLSGWMNLRDIVRVALTSPPAEIGGDKAEERWIDIDLSTQMLVAYDGTQPRYATLVSAGRGNAGSDTATPRGRFRIGSKMESATVNNPMHEGSDTRASLPGVPYVQLFDGVAALQGAYWHDDFGRPRNQKGVHLSPSDAKWLFDFTSPHMPKGWASVRPTPIEAGTLIVIR